MCSVYIVVSTEIEEIFVYYAKIIWFNKEITSLVKEWVKLYRTSHLCCFVFILLINVTEENIKQHSCWNYSFINYNPKLATIIWIWQKPTKIFLGINWLYGIYNKKLDILFVHFILHILYTSKIYSNKFTDVLMHTFFFLFLTHRTGSKTFTSKPLLGSLVKKAFQERNSVKWCCWSSEMTKNQTLDLVLWRW